MKPARRFAFRLALALGCPNPDAMLAQMPYRVFQEWKTYYQYDPFGGERGDINAATIAATIANVNRTKKTKRFKVRDFVPRYGPKEPLTGEEMLQKIMAMNQAMGGTFIDKREK